MIPLRDVIPSRTTPYITVTIIGINAAAWLFELTLSDQQLYRLLTVFGVVPAAFAWPTLLTSMFLHGGWAHIIGNMLYLWIFGDNVEDRFGHARFLIFYLLAGTVAAFGQILMDPASQVPTIGASGAIAGVMGAYIVLYPHSRVLTLLPLIIVWEVVEVPAVFLLGFWFLLQLFNAGAIAVTAGTSAAQGGVAFMAHVAGFVFGLLAVFAFRRRREPRRWTDM
ncbi:MAG: rhomboid family intramembrane serine protease [Acidobacteria bacterium]|nr:rhomboid family intramembrane serine protease [Acidobacteriota bacterium]